MLVTVLGDDLDDLTDLVFSHSAIKAERLPDAPEPPDKKDKKPAPPQSARFKITVSKDAPPGLHDIRAVGKRGISNPRAFTIGDLPEVAEKENNNDVPEAQVVAVDSTVNGVIKDKIDVDYFRFDAKRGQRIVVHCAASSIDSRLMPLVQVYDEAGKLFGSSHHHLDRDAVVAFTPTADGPYFVRLCEFAYQFGGNDYFYRLTVSQRPWIDAVFPTVVTAGKSARLTVHGHNLPEGAIDPETNLETASASIEPPSSGQLEFPGRLLPNAASIDGRSVRVSNVSGQSNPAFVAITRDPVILDNRANDTAATAQPIRLPCVIAGLVEKARDRDYFVFEAKKGDTYVIEGYADRVRSPVDLVIQVKRLDNGQIVGTYDDNTEVPLAVDRFYMFTNDPVTRFVAPADCKYELLVRSQTGDLLAGPRHAYHVALRKESADYHLVVVGNHEFGSGLTLHRGGSYDLSIFCFRHDGFQGDVELKVEGLPAGVTCPPQRIGPRQSQGALVLNTSDSAADWAGLIRIKGSAVIEGKRIEREARSGCLVYPTAQPNNPALSRLTRSLALAVRDKGPFRLATSEKAITVPAGGQVKFKVKVDRQFPEFKDNIQIAAVSVPAQDNGKPINIAKTTIAADKDGEVKFIIPTTTEAGSSTLVLRGTGKFDIIDAAKKKRNVSFSSTLPPISLIVFKEAVELTVPVDLKLKAGEEHPFAVKVKRLHDFKGELQIEFDPSGSSGLASVKGTIAPGADSATLVIKVAKDAKPAAKFDAVLRTIAKIDGATLKQEAKLSGALIAAIGAKDPPKSEPPNASFKVIGLLDSGAGGWKYQSAAEIKGEAWRGLAFDDKSWNSAKAPFGYGEDVIQAKGGTVIAETGKTLLCRRVFDVPAEMLNQKGASIVLQVASDDGAIVFINGQKADEDEADHEFKYWNREVEVPASFLRPGPNVLAVELRNGAGSSDAFLDAALAVRVPQSLNAK